MALRGMWSVAFSVLWLGGLHPASAPAEDSGPPPTVRRAVVRLLAAGFHEELVPQSELEGEYRRGLNEIGGPHPHLEYAYAIVLMKNLEPDAAQPHLQQAAQSNAPVVPAAREELIRQLLREREYSEALEALVELAEAVGNIPPAGAAGSDARRSAGWIGTIVAFLEGPLGDEATARDAKIVSRPIRIHLGAAYVDAYESGREEVGLTYHDLGRQLVRASRDAEKKKEEQEEKLRQRSEQLAEQGRTVKEASKELVDVANSDLSDIDAKLTALEKQFAVSLQTETGIQVSQAALRTQIFRLQRQLSFFQSNQTNGINRRNVFALEQQIGLAETQLATLTTDYALLLQSRAGLVRLAEQLIARRQALTASYSSQLGVAREQVEMINRWQTRLEETAKQQAGAPVTKMPGIATLRRRMRDLSTYESRSFEQQRDFLLALVGVAVPEQK